MDYKGKINTFIRWQLFGIFYYFGAIVVICSDNSFVIM